MQQGVNQLDMLAITNYDEDHASASANLFANVFLWWLFRNKSVSAPTIKTLKREQGIGPGIECLVDKIETNFNGGGPPTAQPVLQGAEHRFFCNTSAMASASVAHSRSSAGVAPLAPGFARKNLACGAACCAPPFSFGARGAGFPVCGPLLPASSAAFPAIFASFVSCHHCCGSGATVSRLLCCSRPVSRSPTICCSLYSPTSNPLGLSSVLRSSTDRTV